MMYSTSNRVKSGDIAGTLGKQGYISIKVDKVLYQAHRLAVLYCTGEFPCSAVDHIDCNKANNSILNLRSATSSDNNRNVKLNITNTSGIKGVSWDRRECKWRAQLTIEGIVTSLGNFISKLEAEQVVRAARELHHGEFANHG